jgi:flagellar biosynthesis component FlhA
MQVGLVILDNAALYQDSIELGEITIEEFLKSISKQWKREVVSAFLVNDGTKVLDLTKEQDNLITDIYNKYEFELEYSELWIEVKVGKILVRHANKDEEEKKKKRKELLLAKVKDARETLDNALAELEREQA